MNKKLKAWLFMISGGALVAVWIAHYLMGRLGMHIEMSVSEYKFYQDYGVGIIYAAFAVGIVMVVIGRIILKKENIRLKEEQDEKELNPGENIVYKKSGKSALVIVTNMRVRYYGYLTNELRKSVRDVPDSDREDYEHSMIKQVKPVLVTDLVKSRFTSKAGWGVQLELKDGRIINIPVEDQDEVAGRIDNARRMAL